MRITEDVLKRYLDLKERSKLIEQQLQDIRKAIVQERGARTRGYTAVISKRERECMAPKEAFEKYFKTDWLRSRELIVTIQYEQVDVFKNPIKGHPAML